MAESTQAAHPTFWSRLKLIGLIFVCAVLAALGGIGVALGLMQGPAG